ncbi:hypothetical protein BC834DRAFT_864802 [Gloeopeniophorella convolvens]|nr:hypothetical protein BC834DRAFT_864802 [Gloeopeniophorella convolvens]
MSMYPQHQAYSQPPFPHAYPSQTPSYALPSSSSTYPVDPGTFRRDYTARLAELTVNSRPIIQGLSMYAHDFSRWADVVTQCIEAHIRRVPPWMKLPAFYLVDALSKNVFEPYAGHFASVVAPLFLESYQQVDQQTRGKMEEMLLTWRTGAPNGRELFGVGPQVAIERGVWPSNMGQSSPHPVNSLVSKSQVLSELEFALSQKERSLQSNPYDAIAQNHINVLSQLRKLVETGVSQDELAQILTQLRSLVRLPTANPAPLPNPPPAKYASAVPYSSSSTYHQPVAPPGPSVVQPQYAQALPSIFANVAQQLQRSDMSQPPVANLPAVNPTPPAIPSISGLYEVLVKAGVVPATSAPAGTDSSAQPVDENSMQDQDMKPPLKTSSSQVQRSAGMIVPFLVHYHKLTHCRHRPNMVHNLYDRMPVQCKQCGLRFPDTVQGKKTMQEHLDTHFRQNRKASQSVGRGYSRSWFLGVEDWVHDSPYSSGEKNAGPSSRPSNAKAVAAAESAKRDAELRARAVVVPPGDEAKHIACPICKEAFKSEFNEDDEEWVWKNALKFDNKIYHATCHAEALTSSGTLTARLRQSFTGSRSGTPDAPPSRATPPRIGKVNESPSPTSKSGTKRKVEANSVEDRPGGSPPLKKAMISASA